MPIVDPEVLEKLAKERKAAIKSPDTKVIDGNRIFKGALDVWYSSSGEALNSLQEANEQVEYKRLGLNEKGQTPEQVLRNEKLATLYEKRNKLVEKITEIDNEIGKVNSGVDTKEEKPKSKK